MAKSDNSPLLEQMQIDVTLVKRMLIGVLVIVGLAGAFTVFGTYRLGAASKQNIAIDDYIENHMEAVKQLIDPVEGLTFKSLVFGYRQAKGDTAPQYDLDVRILADRTTPLTEYDTAIGAIKPQLDELLLDPPLGAKVRLVLTSETVLE